MLLPGTSPEKKLAQQVVEERLRFERLLSDLSARFVNIPPDRVDSEIERALKEVLDFFKVDRCGLLRTLPDKASWQSPMSPLQRMCRRFPGDGTSDIDLSMDVRQADPRARGSVFFEA